MLGGEDGQGDALPRGGELLEQMDRQLLRLQLASKIGQCALDECLPLVELRRGDEQSGLEQPSARGVWQVQAVWGCRPLAPSPSEPALDRRMQSKAWERPHCCGAP